MANSEVNTQDNVQASPAYGGNPPSQQSPDPNSPNLSISSTQTQSTGQSGPRKRIRLSLACNQCRRRKVRCDTEVPKCRNCWLRDDECETTDPRYPDGVTGVRRWATKDGLLPGQNPEATHRNHAYVPKHGPIQPAVPNANGDQQQPQAQQSQSLSEAPVQAQQQQQQQRQPQQQPPLPHEQRNRRQSQLEPNHVVNLPNSGADSDGWGSLSHQTAASPSLSSTATAVVLPVNDANSAVSDPAPWTMPGYRHGIPAAGTGGGSEERLEEMNPDMVLNADSATDRVKYMGGSSVQCLASFVDLYLRKYGLKTISTGFRGGMRYAEEFPLPLFPSIAPLPNKETADIYFKTFFSCVWPLVPVVDRAYLDSSLQYFYTLQQSSLDGLKSALSAPHIPQLVCLYCIFAIGADESAPELTDEGEIYLQSAYGLLAHLVATPYLSSVQALALLSVALRCRHKDGQSWNVLAQAIRVAQSIGLHRNIRHPPSSHQSVYSGPHKSGQPLTNYSYDEDGLLGLHARVWWSCYALEKLMELETGRPSATNDEEVDQETPPEKMSINTDNPLDIFGIWVALSRINSQISRRIYKHKFTSAHQMITDIQSLDRRLLAWANALPETMRPGADVFGLDFSGGISNQLSCFLLFQYYQAQITLLRASLVLPMSAMIEEVHRQGPQPLPSYIRLLKSESICTSAARAMLRLTLDLSDHGLQSHLWSATQPFLAIIVLALHVLKNPGKLAVRGDTELLVTAAEYIEGQFRKTGQHSNFLKLFETLRESVSHAAAANSRSGPRTQATNGQRPAAKEDGLVGQDPINGSRFRPMVVGNTMPMIDGESIGSFLDNQATFPDLGLDYISTDFDVYLDDIWNSIKFS